MRRRRWLFLINMLLGCGGREGDLPSHVDCSTAARGNCTGGSAARARGLAGGQANSATAGAGFAGAGFAGAGFAGAGFAGAGFAGAGFAGAGFAGAPASHLDGYYDIQFGAAPLDQPLECASSWAAATGRLLFGMASPCSIPNCTSNALELAQLWGPQLRSKHVEYGSDRVVLSNFEYVDSSDRVTQLKLPTDDGEFVGSGTATIHRQCKDGSSTTFDVTVTLARDKTPARLYPNPPAIFAPYAVSWGAFRIGASESLELEEFPDGMNLASFVGLENVDAEGQRSSLSMPSSPFWGLHIDNPEAVSGTTQHLYLKRPLFDTAGNPVEAGAESVRFAEDTVITDVLDFDTVAPHGVVGASTYFPPASTNAPCELGGCLLLGPVSPCTDPLPTFYSMRLAPSQPSKLHIRLAIQANSELRQYLARWVDQGMYAEYGLNWPDALAPLPSPIGNMNFSTPFFDWSYIPVDAAQGGAIAFACDDLPDSLRDTAIQLIIERIELVPSGG